ncbi:MAG: hypothetical protein E7104_09295 [Prevotella sp.]|jgi:hypothetical protein|nr:hypothetical protein [Prevotella sp.]
MSSKYNQAECDKKYNNCLRSSGSGVNIETLYWMAGNAGINLSEFAREHKNYEFCATRAIAPCAKNIEKVVKSSILGSF